MVREVEGELHFLVGLHDEDVLLREAEKQKVMSWHTPGRKEKREKALARRALQHGYLDERVIEAEARRPFVMAYREEFEDGDFDAILSEADKSRLFYIVLDRVRVGDTPAFLEEVGERYAPVSQKETLLFFLKRHGLLEEIGPLWSKAHAVRAAKEGN